MAAPHHPRFLDGLLTLGQDYRRNHDLGEPFERAVNSFFAAAVVREYWGPIRRHFGRNCYSLKDAGAAAGVNRSTISRLLRSKTRPTLPTLCLMFAWLGLDMKHVLFPGGRDALHQAFFRTVGHIRERWPEDEREAKGTAPFDHEQWQCLRLAVASEAVFEALKAGKEGQSQMNAATDPVLRELGRRVPNGRIRDGQGVRQVFRDWLIPWVLFCTVIPHEAWVDDA